MLSFDLRHFERKSVFLIFGVIFWVSLELGYRLFVSPLYAYAGFLLDPDWIKYCEGWLVYLVLVSCAPAYLSRPSDFFINILLFGLMAPLLVFYGLADQSREHLYTVVLGYGLVDVFRRGLTLRIPVLKEGRLLAITAVVFGVTFVSVWLVWSGGLQFFNLDLTEVYDYRRSVGELVRSGVMGYVNTWAYKVFGPALLALALWKRHFWLAALVVMLHVYWFGVSSQKSVLFYPFVILFVWLSFSNIKALSFIPLAMSFVVVTVLLMYLVMDYVHPASWFIRRVFFVVADNTFYYYRFFSENELVYWSNSVLSGFLDYPYDTNPAQLIGDSRGTHSHVNNTFLSTGYMHAGLWGIIFYGVVAGAIFRLVDSLSAAGVPIWVAISVLIVPSRSLLLSADLPTALATHGIVVALVILLLFRSSEHVHSRYASVRAEKSGFVRD